MAQQGVERRLAAILCADVVGYSRLMGADEAGTLGRLKAHREELVDPKIAEHRGRLVKTTGDGLLVEFASVVSAVQCAADIQRGMAERNARVPQDRRIVFRLGINLGDIIVEGNDIYGDGVNVAARLEGLAEPGGICISGDVHRQVRNKLDLGFEDLGEREVKNIAEPLRVYRVRMAPADAPVVEPVSIAEPILALPDKPSIAVLPFENMSGDPEQEYFADGVTEEIITALSNVHSFFVIARNSTFTYKGRAVDVKQVGRELGVRYVLEGSVRKAGDRIRVTAQLVDAGTGSHIWADRYDGTLADIFDLQDEITQTIVGTIDPKLTLAEVDRAKRKRPESLDAYDCALRGLSHMDKLTPEDTTEALRLFRMAIEIDPNYARAYVYAAWCYRRQVQIGGMNFSEKDKAEAIRLAHAALEADKDDPINLWQAGMTAALLEDDFEGAMALIDRSLAINPNSRRAWLSSGLVRCYVGDPETALEHAERAMRLSPLDTSDWVRYTVMATAHIQIKRYENAARWAKKAIRENANNLPAYHILAASCAHLGRGDEARATMRRILELEPGLTISRLKQIYPVAGYANLAHYLDGLRKAGLAQ